MSCVSRHSSPVRRHGLSQIFADNLRDRRFVHVHQLLPWHPAVHDAQLVEERANVAVASHEDAVPPATPGRPKSLLRGKVESRAGHAVDAGLAGRETHLARQYHVNRSADFRAMVRARVRR